jgi:hypothetical protein
VSKSKPVSIVPVVPSETSVAAGLEAAKSFSARAVVELRDGVLLLHPLATLSACAARGQGAEALSTLHAIRIGEPAKPPSDTQLHIALSFDLHFSVKDFNPASPMWMVVRPYKCPVDDEPYNGPGVCCLHDVRLVQADTE